jgi:hypothetical protein
MSGTGDSVDRLIQRGEEHFAYAVELRGAYASLSSAVADAVADLAESSTSDVSRRLRAALRVTGEQVDTATASWEAHGGGDRR